MCKYPKLWFLRSVQYKEDGINWEFLLVACVNARGYKKRPQIDGTVGSRNEPGTLGTRKKHRVITESLPIKLAIYIRETWRDTNKNSCSSPLRR
jgi:hypothetical protein